MTVTYIEAIRTQIEGMWLSLILRLPSLVIALFVILVTWVAVRFTVNVADRIVRRTQIREDLRQLVETLVKLGIWITGLMIAAAIVIPGLTPASLIAGLGVGALAIGFAFQDIFENFLAGVLIMIREKMRIGDVVECEGILGKVEKITLRETHIRQLSNELTILPNSMLFKNPVKIFTDERIRRDELVVGVAYDTDLAKAKAAIQQAMHSLDIIHHENPVEIYAQEFNSSSIDFLVRWWTDSRPRDLRETKSQVVFAIKQALDDAGIEIPFPYVTHTFKQAVPLQKPENEAA